MIIDHIGYLVKDIKRAIHSFEDLGYIRISKIFEDTQVYEGKARNIYICFLKKDHLCIELVSPIQGMENDVQKQLQRQGEGPYHICYRVESLNKTIDSLKEKGYFVTKFPAPAIACRGKVAFLYKNAVGLIELLELDNNKDIKN